MTETATRQTAPDQAEPISVSDAADDHVAREQAGALNRLYHDHAKALTQHLRNAFGNGPPDPEDITQDAFARLASQHDLSKIRRPRAFIWRMARNLMVSGMRGQVVRSKYDFEIEHLFFAMEGSEKSPERVLEVREQLKIINDAISNMPETRRLAFLMRRIDGLSFSAIARQLNMSPNGIIKHVSRGVRDIQMALEKSSEPD